MTIGAATPDPARCPLCGQANRCAMEIEKETGAKQVPCWCASVKFDQALLSKIPAASQGLACVCEACARQAANLAF